MARSAEAPSLAEVKLQKLLELKRLRDLKAERDRRERASRPRRWQSPLELATQLDSTVVRTPALNLINDALVRAAHGQIDRLMISVPPQEGKSTTVSRWFPTWMLSQVDPDTRCIMISYSDEIARRWGSDVKRDFEAFDGDDGSLDLGVRLRSDSRAAGRWQVEGRRGGMFCAGVAGSTTGRPCDLMIIDDPIKDLEQAQSPNYRERFQRFWQGVAVPRLGPGARVVLVQTRWHDEDAAGWLLSNEGRKEDGGRWTVINIPAQAEEGEPDLLGRHPGEYMISARGDRDWDGIKNSVGSYVWAALYQGRPAPAEGGLFKRLWWRYHSIAGNRVVLGGREFDLRDCWRFATVDLAASTRTSADFTVIAAWARTITGDLVLLDLVRARIGEQQHFAQARPLVQRWNLDTVFVEASQYGTTLVREATQENVPISPIQAEQDKFSRALPYSAWVSSGRVWLPSSRPHWLDAFLAEHASFPAAAHDDTVDVGSMAVRVAVTKWAPPSSPTTTPAAIGEVDFMTAPM